MDDGQVAAADFKGSTLTKYIQPAPLPGAGIIVATPSGTNRFDFTRREIERRLIA